MKAWKSTLALFVLVLAGVIAARPGIAQTNYKFTMIDGPGAYGTYVYGITDERLVSGFYLDAAGFEHGFLWKNGVLTTLDHPGSSDTLLGPINARGILVGNYDNTIVGSAVLYNLHTGTWLTLPGVVGSAFNDGNGISDSGLVVGSATDVNGNNGIGWVWNGTAYSFFTVPGATGLVGTFASGINDRGHIAGYFQDAAGMQHGFLKEGARYTTLDVPGSVLTRAFSINNAGDIVGRYDLSDGSRHGFIRSMSRYITVDVPLADNPANKTILCYMNERGDLAGFTIDSLGIRHGFIAIRP